MIKKQLAISAHGLIRLKNELSNLQSHYKNLAGSVRHAAESREQEHYAQTLAEQQMTLRRIYELDEIISKAKPLKTIKSGYVGLGSGVRLKSGKKELKVVLVDSVEADPLNNMVSIDSPLGKALIGKKVNAHISYKTPAGLKTCTIVEIF